MSQRPTEALAEPANAVEQADEAERDRVAWNLPLSAPDEAARRADDAKLDTARAAEKAERERER
jgi:hypothetical protein